MAYENFGIDINARSSGDTSANQYHLMVLSTTYTADGCVLATTAVDMGTGIWQNNSTQAENGKLRVVGVTKAVVTVASAAVAPGTRLQASTGSAGHLTVYSLATGHKAVGFALEALSTGSTGIISIFMLPSDGSTST